MAENIVDIISRARFAGKEKEISFLSDALEQVLEELREEKANAKVLRKDWGAEIQKRGAAQKKAKKDRQKTRNLEEILARIHREAGSMKEKDTKSDLMATLSSIKAQSGPSGNSGTI